MNLTQSQSLFPKLDANLVLGNPRATEAKLRIAT
jgi:hypothetical protein